MKPSEYIRKGWTQHESARDSKNNIVLSTDPRATCWCMLGAIKAAYPEEQSRRRDICTKLRNKITDIISFNDDPKRTQQEVIDLLESVGE